MSETTHPAGTYDVVVVGGGASGLSGALTLARAGRSVVVIDAGEPRNAPAEGVHNYLGREGTNPLTLLEIGRAEVRGYGGEILTGRVAGLTVPGASASGVPVGGGEAADVEATGVEATGVEATGVEATGVEAADVEAASVAAPAVGFEATLEDGRRFAARRVLVATGLTDELPAVAGLREQWGHGVVHCPYCHGYEIRDQAIGVLGVSAFAAHQALLFRGWSADVTLFLHTAPAPTDEEAERLAARGITVVEGEVAAVESADGRLTGVRLRSGEVVPRQALAVMPRFRANAEVLAGLGLGPTDHAMGAGVGEQVPATSPFGATGVPGVFVAGNVSDLMATVVGAADSGVRAGAGIHADLMEDETRQAVEAHRRHAPAVGAA
jgi:thioredoxin reductase